LSVLLGSVVANYAFGARLLRAATPRARRAWLGFGVAANLGLLFVFKYAVFALTTLASATGWPLRLGVTIVLPIGISFYTFQQIAYLVDIYRGEAVMRDPLRYALFVTFFLQKANAVIRASGLIVVPGTPVCMPFDEAGDAADHVASSLRERYSEIYRSLIGAVESSQAVAQARDASQDAR
jgi:hypothetical protein